jgi:hypothetical protein
MMGVLFCCLRLSSSRISPDSQPPSTRFSTSTTSVPRPSSLPARARPRLLTRQFHVAPVIRHGEAARELRLGGLGVQLPTHTSPPAPDPGSWTDHDRCRDQKQLSIQGQEMFNDAVGNKSHVWRLRRAQGTMGRPS